MIKVLSLKLIYSSTLETLRPEEVGGVVGDPVAYLDSIRSSMPIAADPGGLTGLQESNIIQTLTEVFYIFVSGSDHDIAIGDTVTIDGASFIVRLVQAREIEPVISTGDFMRLTVERLTK